MSIQDTFENRRSLGSSANLPWVLPAGWCIVFDPDNARRGSWALHWEGSSDPPPAYLIEELPVGAGERLQAFGFAKRVSGSNAAGRVQISWRDEAGAEIGSPSSGNSITSGSYGQSRLLDTAPAGAVSARLQADVEGAGGAAHELFFDDVFAQVVPEGSDVNWSGIIDDGGKPADNADVTVDQLDDETIENDGEGKARVKDGGIGSPKIALNGAHALAYATDPNDFVEQFDETTETTYLSKTLDLGADVSNTFVIVRVSFRERFIWTSDQSGGFAFWSYLLYANGGNDVVTMDTVAAATPTEEFGVGDWEKWDQRSIQFIVPLVSNTLVAGNNTFEFRGLKGPRGDFTDFAKLELTYLNMSIEAFKRVS